MAQGVPLTASAEGKQRRCVPPSSPAPYFCAAPFQPGTARLEVPSIPPRALGRARVLSGLGTGANPQRDRVLAGPSFVRRSRAAPPLGGSLLPAKPDNRRGRGAARSRNFPRGRRRLGRAMEEGASAAPPLWNWDYLERCFARRRVCISFGLWICAACCWIAAHTL